MIHLCMLVSLIIYNTVHKRDSYNECSVQLKQKGNNQETK